jgi:hypothetical protein
VKLKATGCIGADSIIKNAYITINVPSTPFANGATACGNSVFTLSATGNSVLKWFASPSATSALGTGSVFTTPNLSTTTTYYVANTVANSPAFGGLLTNSGGNYLTNATACLLFDVTQNSTLNSVVVYAQTAGNRIVELRNSNSVVLNTTTQNLTVGANTLILNYNLVPGTNYQLGLNSGSASGLYRTNTGVSFPYTIAGAVSINNSSAGTGFYYYFYNWKVTKVDCSSPLVAVTATVLPGPQVSISAPTNLMCKDDAVIALGGSPSGGNFGGLGLIGASGFDPSAGVGNYTLFYMFTDAMGCSGTDSLQMQVSACTGISNNNAVAQSVSIYPNPAKDNLKVTNRYNLPLNISIADASGRIVMHKELVAADEVLNISKLANGLYLISIKDDSEKTLKTLKLIKE